MKAMIKSDLGTFWRQEELKRGQLISIQEVSRDTGVSHDAIARMKKGTTTRFDSSAVGKLCQYFGVPEGDPVPFLKVKYVEQ